jgi:hypothetical protein
MRQVLSGRSLEQIERNIKKRIVKKADKTAKRNGTGK